jgi:hypothetical protein
LSFAEELQQGLRVADWRGLDAEQFWPMMLADMVLDFGDGSSFGVFSTLVIHHGDFFGSITNRTESDDEQCFLLLVNKGCNPVK